MPTWTIDEINEAIEKEAAMTDEDRRLREEEKERKRQEEIEYSYRVYPV